MLAARLAQDITLQTVPGLDKSGRLVGRGGRAATAYQASWTARYSNEAASRSYVALGFVEEPREQLVDVVGRQAYAYRSLRAVAGEQAGAGELR